MSERDSKGKFIKGHSPLCPIEKNKFYIKGQIPWNKGKKLSKKHIKNLSKSHMGKFSGEGFKKGHIPTNKGLKASDEIKIKLSLSHKGQHNSPKTQFKKGENKGAENYRWRGGISSENKTIRGSIEMQLWKNSVLSRDGWTCQKYETKDSKLHVHHIKNFSSSPELRFAIDNGITLSAKAHKEFHKKYGIRNNTREQMDEFINEKGTI